MTVWKVTPKLEAESRLDPEAYLRAVLGFGLPWTSFLSTAAILTTWSPMPSAAIACSWRAMRCTCIHRSAASV